MLTGQLEIVAGLVARLAGVEVRLAVVEPVRNFVGVVLDERDDLVDHVVLESTERRRPIDTRFLGDDSGGSSTDPVHLRERALDGLRPIEVSLTDADEVPKVFVVLLFLRVFLAHVSCICVWSARVATSADGNISLVYPTSWRGFEPGGLTPHG